HKRRPYSSTKPAGLPTRPVHPNEPHTVYRKDEIQGGQAKDGIVAKITAAPVGGEMGERKKERLEMRVKGEEEGKNGGKAFGVPSVRWGKRFVAKKLGDVTNWGDDSSAKALICPTPRNVYGIQQLAEFERHLRNLDWKTVPKPPPTATTLASNPNPYPYPKTLPAIQGSMVAV
ncbi:hypothetical protein HK097_000106, partial [Rhizophlyctis rosea]